MNYTYLLECADKTFYCGWTNDLEKRVNTHNMGRGAKYTKPRRPVVLVYYEAFETKREAMSREAAIKRMTRKEKEALDSRRNQVKHKTKKLLCSVLAFCQLFAMTAFARPDWPSDTGIQAEAGALMDVDSGTMIFGQNSHVEYPPASITKLLTALIVLEHAELSDTVTYSETAMNSVEADSGNKYSLAIGDTMTVEDCLYALLLSSVNQSANALAEHVAGSIPAFVDMMNQKLAELGCNESHFENPSGLNGDTQNVSAYDMAKIACAAFQNEKLLEISSSVSHEVGPTTNNPNGFTVRQEHRLVITEDTASEFYCPEAVAGKTGYLLKAGNTLVTYGEKDGRRLVSVILKGSPRQYFLDGKALLQFGFDRFQNVGIAENETRYVTGEEAVDIGGTSYNPADLMVEEGKVVTLPEEASFGDAELSLEALPEEAPANAVALLQYVYNERKVGQAYLLDKTIQVPAETEPSGGDAAEPGTEDGSGETGSAAQEPEDTEEPTETASVDPEKTDGRFSMKLPKAVIPGVILAVLAALGAGLWMVWIRKRRKEEAEAAARRRERRRQRLMEEGPEAAAEFNRLLEEKKNRSQGRGHRR